MSRPEPETRLDAGTIESLEDPAVVRDVAAWVTQLLRTIKTCRLYDPANPTVTRFRSELAQTMNALLGRSGTLRLEIQSTTMTLQEHPVFEARSRDDNLPGYFHRDGVRALTFHPGILQEELDGLIDVILNVSGPTPGDDDLVTLLWEANLPHVEVTAVPLEGDVDGGDEEGAEETAAPVPWPDGAKNVEAVPDPGSQSDPKVDPETRSDDWSSVDGVADPEVVFAELNAVSAPNRVRFEQELRAAYDRPLVAAVAEILGDALVAEPTLEDRAEIARFVPRLLREAIGQGEWPTAAEALRMLRECPSGESIETVLAGISTGPSPVTRNAVSALDSQGDEGVNAFCEFALTLGSPAATWLMHVLAESQQRRVRQPLLKVISTLAEEEPSVILPWLSDERWYVVRNVVHVFSQIGGDAVGEFVRAVVLHPEPRVRREVVDVLSRVDGSIARPMLIAMLEVAEPRLYATIIQRLAQDPAQEVTITLLSAFETRAFSPRTQEERRAILMALATRGDETLAALEAELNRGGLFSRTDDEHVQAIALCLARVGTPAARGVLDRGAKAGKSGVRKACAMALRVKGVAGD